MPQLLRIGPYSIYFWSNEGNPLEPIHVHISEGRAKSTATKIWITSTGNVILSNNNSQIPKSINLNADLTQTAKAQPSKRVTPYICGLRARIECEP